MRDRPLPVHCEPNCSRYGDSAYSPPVNDKSAQMFRVHIPGNRASTSYAINSPNRGPQT